MESLAKEPVEDRSGRPDFIGRPHLSEDLALARHHRIEPSGDAEEMQRGRLVLQTVERRPKLLLECDQCRFASVKSSAARSRSSTGAR